MAFVDDVKTRIESTRKQWEEARKAAREAKTLEASLYEALSALERVLEVELSRNGRQPELRVVSEAGEEPSKAEMIRRVIRQHSPNGLSPAEIRGKLKEAGCELNDTYVYSVLMRTKKAGKIRDRNGRYYAVEEEKAEAAG